MLPHVPQSLDQRQCRGVAPFRLAIHRALDHPSMLGAIPAAAADSVGHRERAERLRAAMLELPDNYRRVLDLHYLCQMRYEDVARALGYQRVEPVRLLAHRARVALGGLLGVDEWRPE